MPICDPPPSNQHLANEMAILKAEVAEIRRLLEGKDRPAPPLGVGSRSCTACWRTGICHCVINGPQITYTAHGS
jgi:hypothetical protein